MRLGVGAMAVAAVYAIVVALADAQRVVEAIRALDAETIAVALGLVVLVYVVRSLRWRLYMGHLGVLQPQGPIGFWSAFAMGIPQGKWGQVVKAWALWQRGRARVARTVPTIFAERISDVMGGLLHLVVALALVPAAGIRVLAAGLAFVALLLLALRSRGIARQLVARLSFIPWVRRHEPRILDGHARLRDHLRLRELAAPSTMALAAFLMESLVLYVVATHGMGLDVTVAEAILFVAIMDAAATITLLPGGIGASEGSLLVLLTLDGAPIALAGAATIAYRVATLWFGIGLGVAATAALHAWPQRRAAGAAPQG